MRQKYHGYVHRKKGTKVNAGRWHNDGDLGIREVRNSVESDTWGDCPFCKQSLMDHGVFLSFNYIKKEEFPVFICPGNMVIREEVENNGRKEVVRTTLPPLEFQQLYRRATMRYWVEFNAGGDFLTKRKEFSFWFHCLGSADDREIEETRLRYGTVLDVKDKAMAERAIEKHFPDGRIIKVKQLADGALPPMNSLHPLFDGRTDPGEV